MRSLEPARALMGPWLLLGLSGCLDASPLNLPSVQGAQSWVFIAETSPEPAVRITGVDPGVLAVPDAPVTALAYPFDLDSLGLGPQGSLSGAAAELQSLPPPLSAFEVRLGDSFEWIERSAEPTTYESIDIPRPDYAACIDGRGGCIAIDAPWRCLKACPAVQPEPPALPDMRCPPGWLSTHAQTSQLQVCAPALEDLRSCPEGEYQGGPGQPCAPLAPCESGPWPTPPAGPGVVRYVSAAAAAGGDGSMARPWTSLGRAIEDAPEGATLLLSEGTHLANADFSNKTLHIQGLCAQRTEIAGGVASALIANDATLTLSALKVSSQAPAVVAMRGALTLEGVSLSGQGPLLFAQGSQLRAERLRTRDSSGGGILSGEESQVQLRAWDHAGTAGLSMHTGRLSVIGGTVRTSGVGRTVAIDLQSVSTSTLSQLQVDGGPAMAAVAVHGLFRSVVMRDAVLRGSGTGSGLSVLVAPEARAEDPRSHVSLTRVYSEAVSSKAAFIQGANVDADFFVARAQNDSALVVLQNGAWPLQVKLHHLWALGRGHAVVELGQRPDVEDTELRVEGDDWVVESEQGAESIFTVSLRDEVSLTLRRAWVHGSRGAAIDARCADLDLEDLTVINGADRGITAQAPRVFRVHRANFEGHTATALEATVYTARCSDTAPAEVSAVRFEGCPDCTTGVSVQSGARLRLNDVLIEGFGTAGLAGGTGKLEATSSQIQDGRLGFDLNDRTQVDGVVRGVRFDVGQSVTVPES